MLRKQGRLATLFAMLIALMLVVAACGTDDAVDDADVGTTDDSPVEEVSDDEAIDDGADDDALDSDGPQYGGHLRYAPPADVIGFDIRVRTDIPTLSVTELIFQPLVRMEVDEELVPFLATDWEVNDEATQFTFNLRDDVLWHNGDPFTAEDVVFTFESMLDPDFASAQAGTFSGIESVTQVDEFTVEFTLSSPDAEFLLKLARMGTVPKNYIEEVGDDEFNVNPIGTGPFKFVEWIPEERVSLERNDDYWVPELPYLDRVSSMPITEGSVVLAALETGEVELIQRNIPVEHAPMIEEDERLVLRFEPYMYRHFIMMNQDRVEAFQDVRVRQAIAYAIDRDAITEALGTGTPGYGPLPAASAYFNPDLDYYTYDPDRALELLAEAGYEPGDISFTLQTFTYPNYQTVGEVAHAMLQELGFDVSLAIEEWTVVRDRCYLPQAECDMLNTGLGGLGPDGALYNMYHSQGSANFMFYSNPEVDELLERGRATIDEDERREIYDEAIALIIEDSPNIYVNDHDLPTIYSAYVMGFESNPHLSFMQLDRVWIDQDLRDELFP